MHGVPKTDRRAFLRGSVMTAASFSLARFAPEQRFAAIPAGHFDLPQTSTQLWGSKALSYRSGWQGFGFDTVRGRIYYAQPSPLGTSGSVTDAKIAGNFRISYLNLNGSKNDGDYMEFYGFGHAGSIGIETTSSGTYIWVETEAELRGTYRYGKRICVIKWKDNATGPYTYAKIGTSALPESHSYVLKPGSHENSVNIDPVTQRLMLRFYWDGGQQNGTGPVFKEGPYYSVYNLADVRAKGAAAVPLYDFMRESIILTQSDGTKYGPHQGFASYGDYGYILTGGKYETCTISGSSDTHLTCFQFVPSTDPVTPSPKYSVGVHTGESLYYREPEGLAIQMVGSTPRLCIGIKSDTDCSASTYDQVMSVYYKDKILTTPIS
jgi:hypothetical protein